ncbi:MAG: thermopsin family protease [Thermoplasmata archaeon]|nr:thermopsin family protease [Thermoplasmata archaeon]
MRPSSLLLRVGIPVLIWGLLVIPGLPGLPVSPSAGVPSGGAPYEETAPALAGPHGHPVPTEFPPTRSLGVPSTRFAVDPTAYYTSEPAPMGIADFGVNPASGAGYRYATTEFWGVTDISSLSTKNSSLSDSHDLSIQLNINFQVTSGSNSYTYWVQDVAFLNSSDRLIEFIDNVWNMSSSGASMYNSTIVGNGSIGLAGSLYYYYAIANGALAGNDVFLTYPSQIELAMVSTPHGGRPGVAFEYNDGSGWVTYDNIGLRFASGYTVTGFVVDGTSYNSAGLFDDAEMTLGGPGGGTSIKDVQSNLTMTLSYWNGHNFQQVTNAYGFGSDTAESISNVVATGEYWRSNGTLFASEANGSGSLGELYDRSFVGILNVTSLLPAGSLSLNGTSYGTFAGRDMNITVAPGTYALQLFAANGSLDASQMVTIADGAYVALRFGAAPSYRVNFLESGLPPLASWSVTFNGQTLSTTNSSLSFLATNGTYGFRTGLVPGFASTPTTGVLTVNGTAFSQPLVWAPVTYALTFTETGLPAGAVWGVQLNAVAHFTSNASLFLREVNGSYSYSYLVVPGYLPTPAVGQVNLTGAGATIPVQWGLASYGITVQESGLPLGTIWSATLDGITHSSSAAVLAFGLANGSYAYSITSIAGYSVQPRVGTLNISGQPQALSVTFSPVVYTLTFTESGLPAGAEWSVTIGALAAVSTGTIISFSLPNGTYSFEIATGASDVASIPGSTITIDGQGGDLAVPFLAVNGFLQGTILPANASVYLNGSLVRSAGGWVNLTLLPGSYVVTVSLAGFQQYTTTLEVRAGTVTPLNVTLTAIPATPPPSPRGAVGPGGLTTLELGGLLAAIAVALALVAGAWWVGRQRRRPRRWR